MEQDHYRVVLSGELVAERSADEAAEALAKLFKQPKELVLKLFSGNPYPIKQTLPREQARKLREHILAAGAECYLEAVGAASKASFISEDVPPPEPTPRPTAPAKAVEPEAEAEDEALSHSQEWYLFVGPGADYYVERFEQFRSTGGYAFRWSWAGFFFPVYWALYRKMWMWAVLFLGISMVPFLNLLAWIGLAGSVNYIYYRHVQAECDFLRKRHRGEELERRLAERGGTHPTAAWGAAALTVLILYLSVSTMTVGIEQAMEEQRMESRVRGESLPEAVLETPRGQNSYGKMSALYISVMVVGMQRGAEGIEGMELAELAEAAALEEGVLYDGWDGQFELSVRDGRVRITSAGPDGYFGNDDDLVLDRGL